MRLLRHDCGPTGPLASTHDRSRGVRPRFDAQVQHRHQTNTMSPHVLLRDRQRYYAAARSSVHSASCNPMDAQNRMGDELSWLASNACLVMNTRQDTKMLLTLPSRHPANPLLPKWAPTAFAVGMHRRKPPHSLNRVSTFDCILHCLQSRLPTSNLVLMRASEWCTDTHTHIDTRARASAHVWWRSSKRVVRPCTFKADE